MAFTGPNSRGAVLPCIEKREKEYLILIHIKVISGAENYFVRTPRFMLTRLDLLDPLLDNFRFENMCSTRTFNT